MVTEINTKEPLQEELERLEAALDTPSVPGEMSGWASMVRKSFDAASRAILKQIESVHPGQLREIDGQDAELMTHTAQMREEDRCHQDWCRRLSAAFADFEAKAVRAGADEKQVTEQQQALLEDGLKFVTHVRKQEAAIRNWLQESFARDTGTGD